MLDHIPTIDELAWQDLTQHVDNVGTGAEGMSGQQVVRWVNVLRLFLFAHALMYIAFQRHSKDQLPDLRLWFRTKLMALAALAKE